MSSDDVRLVDRRWRIGEAGGITREDVIIVGATNVSVGSWMPHLATQSKCGSESTWITFLSMFAVRLLI